MASLPDYQVFAIRYAELDMSRLAPAGGDPHNGPNALSFYFWVIIHPDGTPYLVDVGFSPETATKRRRVLEIDPIDGLALLGIFPEQVSDVILTHLHFDHAGGLKRFPNAVFHLQEAEIQFAVGRHMQYQHYRVLYESDDIVNAVRLNFDGRLALHNGRVELAPGLELIPAPGHSAGLQVVRVHTSRGWIVLASDATHLFRNIAERSVFPATDNVPDLLDTYEMLLAAAEDVDHIIPGHDPLLEQIYAAADASNLIFRLDTPPIRSVADALASVA